MMPLVPNSPSLEGMFDLGAKASPETPADGVAFSSLLSQLAVPADGAANPLAALTGEGEATPETSEDKSGQAVIAGLALAATLPMRKSGAPAEAAPEGQDGEAGQDASAPESDQPQAQAQPEALPVAGLVAPLAPTIAATPQTAAALATEVKAAVTTPATVAAPAAPALTAPDAAPQGRADMREILATMQTALTPGGATAPTAAVAAGSVAPKLEGLDGRKSADRAPAKVGSVKSAETDLTALAPATAPQKAHDMVPGLATAPVASLDAPGAGTAKAAGPDAAQAAVETQLDLAHESEWLDRLAKDIARSANSEGSLRFKLHPENLGKLQVELSQGDAGASVRMTTDTESARQIIADAQPRLIAEARAQGVRIAESHVDLSGGGNNDAAQNQSGQRGNAQDDHIRKINQERAEVKTTATTSRLASERYA